MFLDYDITKQSALRFGKWKILTGDPGYPDFPIDIPPQKKSEENDLLFSLPELPNFMIPPRPTPLTPFFRTVAIFRTKFVPKIFPNDELHITLSVGVYLKA